MNTKYTFLGGMAAGATVMYFLEPSGTRRRAVLRDKSFKLGRRLGRFSGRTSRDLFNRSKGLIVEGLGRLRNDEPTGEILAERVRAQLGRAVSDPGAIQVLADNGCVTLRGPVLTHELMRLTRRVGRVRGVRDVVNELTVHSQPGHVPALQGHRRFSGLSTWSPSARLLSGLAAGTVAVFAVAKRVA